MKRAERSTDAVSVEYPLRTFWIGICPQAPSWLMSPAENHISAADVA